MALKKWIRPKLIILKRIKPGESCLDICKTSDATNAGNNNTSCNGDHYSPEPCSSCWDTGDS